MKVYREIRIDMTTGETVFEDSFEYHGDVAECKGGGNSYDANYNARLAAIAEKEQAMSQTAFDSWNKDDGAREFEEKQAKAGIDLLPAQKDLAVAQIGSATRMIQPTEDFQRANMALGLQKIGNQSSIMDKFYASLGQHDETSAMNEAGSRVADAFTNQDRASTLDMQRRGIGYKPNAGLTLEKAKAIGLAQTTGLNDARDRNIKELAMGLA